MAGETDEADKELVVLSGEIQAPPMSRDVRRTAGFLLRQLQQGESLTMPHSRPMPVIGPRCHELRISDATSTWRIMYRADKNEILVIDVFKKKTETTPKQIIDVCKKRLREWDEE